MFRDVYKEAHKEITPDKALLQKVIAMADEKNKKEKKKSKIIPLYTYASIAAAVLLITVSAVIHTNLSPLQTDEKNVLTINSITQENNISVRSSVPSTVSEDEIPNSIYETWSEEEYKNYIGIDIKNEISVPEDMLLFENGEFLIEKNPETNEIINDENSYYYEKDYQRFIIIATSRITDEHKSFLDKTKYQISELNEKNVTVTYDGNLYNAYLITDETGIKITAGGISDEELKKTIISITERN